VKLKNSIILSILLYFVLGSLPVFSEERIFTIGWEPWEPYQFINKEKQLTGLDVELISIIAQQMNCKISYTQLPWKRTLSYVERGQLDLAAGASKTSEREVYAFFSNPYRDESNVIFVLKGVSQKFPFKQLSDIKNSSFQLGITIGYHYGEAFSALMKDDAFKKHVQGVPNEPVNIMKTLKHRVHGYIGDIYAGIASFKKARRLGSI